MNSQKENGFYELKIFVPEGDLCDEIQKRITDHNNAHTNNSHPDSGFDLLTPDTKNIKTGKSEKIDMGVKCVLTFNSYEISYPVPFYIYPRSSTGSKTPLRLANSVGIIDAGYRGNLMVVFDNISNQDYTVEQYQRLVQICGPTLQPFLVSLHNDEKELDKTSRGCGGFGSTGK